MHLEYSIITSQPMAFANSTNISHNNKPHILITLHINIR